jgi:hypothetical protein
MELFVQPLSAIKSESKMQNQSETITLIPTECHENGNPSEAIVKPIELDNPVEVTAALPIPVWMQSELLALHQAILQSQTQIAINEQRVSDYVMGALGPVPVGHIRRVSPDFTFAADIKN